MATRTFVDEDRYLFTTEVSRHGMLDFVAVQWTGLSFMPTDAFLVPLRNYLRPRHEVSEVWFLFPSDLSAQFDELRRSERLRTDVTDPLPRLYRYFSVGLDGSWSEEGPNASHKSDAIADDIVAAIIDDGLRQLFRDTQSLATSAAGFHFAHPSGAHSEHFIRASQSVSRLQHTYFVAAALLRIFRPIGTDLTIWVDTASISTAGYAYADLLRRAGLDGRRRIETFGGYQGLDGGLRPSPPDLVLVSGSTSGSLARMVIGAKNVSEEHVATLFYLGINLPIMADGLVLCDLTNRDANPHPSVREARIIPYTTFKADGCDICDAGSGKIQLEGDSFFPAASELDLRMPSYLDRPFEGERSRPNKSDVPKFDGSSYFSDLFGLNAIRFSPGTPLDGSPHGVTTRLRHLLSGPIGEKIGLAADQVVKDVGPVIAVVSLLDDDSVELGKMLAERFLDSGFIDNLGDSATPVGPEVMWREWHSGGNSFRDVTGGTVLVCGAVVGSGRTLTAISRDLRKLKGEFHTRYFVAVAHPESSTTWNILTQTLERVSDSQTSKLEFVWRLPREPRLPTEKSPWARERTTLDMVGSWLGSQPSYGHLATSLEPRLRELGRHEITTLFVGATGPIAPVNRNFALWPFDWTTQPVGAVPTHAEIYATVAHLLYESRRRSPRIDSRTLTARRHGYALHPAVFDRFNDPVIQAALLRAAEPGELDYATDSDASRAVSDLLWFVLSNVGGEAGDAAFEFLLALCQGTEKGAAYGMRLESKVLLGRLKQLEELQYQGPDFAEMESKAPRLRALLLYLRNHLKS